MTAWVFSATIIFSAIPAPIPTPPSPSSSSPPPPSLLEALSTSASIFSLVSFNENEPSALNSLIFFNAFSSLLMPAHRPLTSPTTALALLSYLLLALAAIEILPEAVISAPELITALVLFFNTTLRPTAPASENSPVLAPATASA